MSGSARPRDSAAGNGIQASGRPKAKPGASAIAAIWKLTAIPAKSAPRKPDATGIGIVVKALPRPPQPAARGLARPDHDHHHGDVAKRAQQRRRGGRRVAEDRLSDRRRDDEGEHHRRGLPRHDDEPGRRAPERDGRRSGERAQDQDQRVRHAGGEELPGRHGGEHGQVGAAAWRPGPGSRRPDSRTAAASAQAGRCQTACCSCKNASKMPWPVQPALRSTSFRPPHGRRASSPDRAAAPGLRCPRASPPIPSHR